MKPFALKEYCIFVLLLIGQSVSMDAKETNYTQGLVKSDERALAGLHGIEKVNTLLQLSDWYESQNFKARQLQKAFDYAQQALRLSRSLHSVLYEGKCYLQLSMLYQLRNNNEMIEQCAREAIALLSKTNHKDDLAEAWVMVWSAKMRSEAPMKEKFMPIRKAAALFKLSGNIKRSSDCYREIGELYYRYKNFPKAMASLEKAMALYKAANLEEKDFYPIYTRLNILYETEKKNKDIIILRNQTLLQQNELKNATFIRNSMITFLALLLIILGLLYKSFKFKKKTNRALEGKQEEINQKNATLRNMLIEKEWLLREIHHRVKNNLHMVVGLLASQTEFLKNEEALQAINSSQNRIHSMSLIHQKLYQSENLSIINMPSYIFELSEYLRDSFHMGKSVRFVLDIDNFDLPLSHSIPIGLIFNEAVTNSIKYAFKDTIHGIINISLKAGDNNNFTLKIRDNGSGLPIDFDPVHNASLGLKLMRGLAEDIQAEFEINSKNGTLVVLKFTLTESVIIT
jgi:two-component sensor histidine kinase